MYKTYTLVKIRHQLTLDEESTSILKHTDNKSEFTENAIKFYSKKELYVKEETKTNRATILEIRKK